MTDDEARRRFLPMNSIGWMVGHMAWQEQGYWLGGAQGRLILPEIDERFASGAPASTPPLDEMWRAWETITAAVDPYLDSLTADQMQEHYVFRGRRVRENAGTLLQRVTYHYWYHIGESQAVRQLLGHTGLPIFVGDIGGEAPYQPES